MNVIKIDVRDDLGNLNPYMVMPMALTALNPDPKSWTVYEFDGDKSSNVVMIIYPKFLLVNTRWYLRWRHHEFGFENWGEKKCNEYEKYDRWVLHNVVDGTSNFEVHIIHSNYGGVYHKEICFSIDNDERQFIHNTDFIHNLQNAYYLCVGHELYHTQAVG